MLVLEKQHLLAIFFKFQIKELCVQNIVKAIIIDFKGFGEGEDIRYEKIQDYVEKKIHAELCKMYPALSTINYIKHSELFSTELIPFKKIIEYKKQQGIEIFKEYIYLKLESYASNYDIFNKARIRYLKEKKRRVFLVFDNIDQFGKKTQEKILGLCMKYLYDYNVNIIASVRDYTLPCAFRHLPAAAFQPRVLHLSLPDTYSILQKRIEYLKEKNIINVFFKILLQDQIKITMPSGINVIFTKSSLNEEFSEIIKTFLQNKEIIEILENISNYNVRTMLELMKIALASGYLFSADREYREIRERDFIRSIMLKNNSLFYPTDPYTIIINLFCDDKPKNQFNNLSGVSTSIR